MRAWRRPEVTGCLLRLRCAGERRRRRPFAGTELRAAFEAEGITVVTSVRVTAARRVGRDGPVAAQAADGREFTGDEILVAVGRRPATADLGLEHVGLEPGAGEGVVLAQAPRSGSAEGRMATARTVQG